MTDRFRTIERLRPLVVLGAVSLHAIAAAAIPVYAPSVVQMFDPSAFVEVDAVVPETPEVAAPPPPEAPRAVVRNTPRPEPVTPPAPAAETPPPVAEPTATPAASEPAAEPAPTMAVGTGGTLAIAGSATGVNGAGVVRAEPVVSTSGTSTAPPVDYRPLLREYVAAIRASVRIPRLRGVSEPVEAVVVVGMHVSPSGQISGVRIVRSSGHPVVDQHVLEVFQNHSRLPAPPPELDLVRREFTYRVEVRG